MWKNRISVILIFAISITGFVLAGCSEDTPVAPARPPEIEALNIICNPLSPEPGMPAQLTVQATGYTPGPWPSYQWHVEAGSLLVDEGISVPWLAPNSTGVYGVTAVMSIGGARDTIQKSIMVRNFEILDTGMSISLDPVYLDTWIYFLGTNQEPDAEDFRGYDVFKYGATPLEISDCTYCEGGYEYSNYYDGFSGYFLGTVYTDFFQGYRQQPMNVIVFSTLPFEEPDYVTNENDGSFRRRNQNIQPFGNEDFSMITWQRVEVGLAEDGTQDLFNIRFRNRDIGRSMTLTTSLDSSLDYSRPPDTVTIYRYYQNIRPMITPGNEYVLYFVDTTKTFEPCLVPIEAGLPDTTQRRALMIDSEIGIFSQADVSVSENTIFQWNPGFSNILGFIDDNKTLCFFDISTEEVETFPDLGELSEFAWSPDGSQSAIVTDTGVFIVGLSGASDNIFTKVKATDEIIGVNWSPDPDDQKIGFRLIRKGKSSIESYSSIIIYTDNNDKWYYALPRIPWRSEPEIDYSLMKVKFDSDNKGILAPIPIAGSGTQIRIYHSYE